MGRPVRRAILWGTMAVGGDKRRSYVFRVDPAGLLAIRIGNPLSWLTFFLIVLLFFLVLPPTPFAIGRILGGGAVGMTVLGLVDRAIARAAATQHVGSSSVRELLAERQPMLGLHDHIHESRGEDRVGRTLVLNPGSEYNLGMLHGVLVDLEDGNVVRHQFTMG